MKWIIYKTVNNINGKFYIGIHGTETPYSFDGYLGSGSRLKRAIAKHGKENFSRETLFVFDNHKDALSKEREIVGDNLVIDENCYNLINGGLGVDGRQAAKNLFTEEVLKDRIEKMKATTSTEKYKEKRRNLAIEQHLDPKKKENHLSGLRKFWDNPDNKEKRIKSLKETMSKPETKEKQRKAVQKTGKPNAGRIGILKDGKMKKVWPKELDHYFSHGWVLQKKSHLS